MDTVDIDALMLKARSAARELNEILEKMERAGFTVHVIDPEGFRNAQAEGRFGYISLLARVRLSLLFPLEGEISPSRPAQAGGAQQAAPSQSIAQQAQQAQQAPALSWPGPGRGVR